MKYFPVLLLLFVLLASGEARTVVSQVGRPKVVEQYDIIPGDYEADQKNARRHLNGLYLYNKMGKLVESWTLTDDPTGSYFNRSVLVWDSHVRLTAVLTYLSAKTAPGQVFSISRSARGVKLLPELEDFPLTVTIKKYDGAGKLLDDRTSDANGNLKEASMSEYDAAGNIIKFRHVDGTITSGHDSVYTDNGRSVENIFQPGPGGPCKSITHRDYAGRELLEEQYYCIPGGDGPKAKPTLALTSRAVRTYPAGDISNLDWTLWNSNGETTQKLLIVEKGDHEISRKEFTPIGSGSQVKWLPAQEKIRDYEYDKAGTMVKQLWRQRPSPDKPFHYIFVQEMVVTYL